MASALIIGIGSSGLHIIEEAQQFYYELTGNNKPEGVEYFYIETDSNQMSKNTALGTSEIKRLFISLANNQATINNLKNSNNPDTNWIPGPATVLNNQSGAGGMSSYGRLALWGNFDRVRAFIQQNYQAINGNKQTRIFIVGTLTGGTGSGLCVDIPYMVRQITQNDNIFGLFLTPDRHSIVNATKRPLFINFFNSMASISKYNQADNTYKIHWPGAGLYEDMRPPYNQVQFISQDFNNADAPIPDVNGLYRIGGLNLMTRLLGMDKRDLLNMPIDTYSDLYDRRMVDAKMSVQDFKFSTLGISMIQYPKSQMEELFAINLSEKTIGSWLDPKNYIDKSGKTNDISSYKTILEKETIKQFDEDLKSCFNILDGKNAPDGLSFTQSIASMASNILDKNLDGKPNASAYILDKFKNNNSSNHYLTIANYRIEIRDQLIKSIHERIVRFLDEFQNIELTKHKLNNIIEAIDTIIKYWKDSYEITEDVTQWNKTLEKLTREIFESNSVYYICRQKKNYLKEQFYNIFTLAKMHVAIEVLRSIKNYLNMPSDFLQTNSFSVKLELPSIKRLDEFSVNLRDAIRNAINNPSLSNRKADLTADLNNNTNQIIRLFEHGNLENDLEQAQANYIKSAKTITYKVFTENKSLWNYLSNNKDSIYTDCLKNGVKFVRDNQLISNKDIVQLLEQIQPKDSQYSKIQTFKTGNRDDIVTNKLPAMIHLENAVHQYQPHNCLKTVILTNNINALRPQLMYKANGTDESIDLPELQNAIIYQQEYGYMGDVNPSAFKPQIHIGYNKTLVTNVLEPEIGKEGNSFYEKRVPYLTKSEFNDFKQVIMPIEPTK